MSNRVEKESYNTLLDILRKERMGVGDWLQSQIDEYNKVHGDGNPAFTLDQFTEDSNFLATPAFHRPIHAWQSFLTKCTDPEYKEWVAQLESLLHLESKVTRLR